MVQTHPAGKRAPFCYTRHMQSSPEAALAWLRDIPRSTGKHGTPTSYNAGCRCDDCRAAHREARERWQARAKAGITKRGRDLPHGQPYTYTNYGCRCEACTHAHSRCLAEQRDRARAEAAAGLRAVPHGTWTGYGYYRCRCDRCKSAAKALRKSR